MAGVIKGLVSGDDLQAQLADRRLDHIERHLAAGTTALLKEKIATELKDGWELKKERKRTAIVKRVKPTDLWLEDRLWTLLARLGFKELNRDRKFMVQEGAGTERQIDVFAKDDECVFVIECTHQKQLGPRSLKHVIDKMNGYRSDVIQLVHKHYGSSPKLKVKFGICTQGIIWSDEDKERVKKSSIAVITDSDLDYFSSLNDILRQSARYNFLARYLHGEKVEGLALQVAATRGKSGGKSFYTFLIAPNQLLKIGYVNHKVSSYNDDTATYQRMIKPNRLKDIANFVKAGGRFPTNIIVNFKTESPLTFQPQDQVGDCSIGVLTLPAQFGCAWIIDGQHRVYGYAASNPRDDDRNVLSVLAYEGLPVDEEIEMFIDINTKQVKVQRSLVNEIIAGLNVDDENPVDRLGAIHAQLAMKLERDITSPLFKRITIIGSEKSNRCCISTASIIDQCKSSGLVGRAQKGSRSRKAKLDMGPLGTLSEKSDDILKKASTTLKLYLSLFADQMKEHWDKGDDPGGYLCTNNGLRPLLLLLAKLLAFRREKTGLIALHEDPKDIIASIEPYVQVLVDFFKAADTQTIKIFRDRGSSLKTVDDNCFQMMSIINEACPDFTSKELQEYKSNRDELGTQEAKVMIDEINRILNRNVIEFLQETYREQGQDWWMEGVPLSIRNKCSQQHNQTGGKQEIHRHLTLGDYSTIVVYNENWETFKDYYNFDGRRKRSEAVSWIVRVTKCKTITDHAERGPLTPDDVHFVKRVHGLVKQHIENESKVSSGSKTAVPHGATELPAVA